MLFIEQIPVLLSNKLLEFHFAAPLLQRFEYVRFGVFQIDKSLTPGQNHERQTELVGQRPEQFLVFR